MITCNGNGSFDMLVIGVDKKMKALQRVPKEDVKALKVFIEERPDILDYTSLYVYHCASGSKVHTYLLVGLDNKPVQYATYEDFRVGRQILQAARKEKVRELALLIDTLEMDIPSLIDGLLYQNYEFIQYKTQASPNLVKNINLITASLQIKELNTLCYVYSSVYEGIYLARDLTNMPSNDLTPRKFADSVQELCKGENIHVESLNKWNLEKRHMGGIVAVGKGSMNPPQLVSVLYQGDPDSKDVLGLVGKGILYDSGGLSLKSHANLEFMKDDMAGAAVVLGVIRALMLLKYPVNVLAVMPLAENIPSGMSYRVDDVITMYNGKTVEVKNTDAEGRLVLADAVAYAQDKGATRIIDFATLTGACVTALGTVRSGMIGNDQEWMNRIFTMAERVHEKVWQFPADREYEKQLQSDIADLKNVGGPEAGAITAGLFIRQFIREGTPWIHFDIAGTAFLEKKDDLGYMGATGTGIKTVLEWLKGGQSS
ncbi:MAG: leucyl aminopeptidase family protein [Caecibacter massiliensis]|nr:leucyl aminopeptidase family protein [Caecibacter massiliensis]